MIWECSGYKGDVAQCKKPTAQTAQLVPAWRDLVFADLQSKCKKPKKPFFANAQNKQVNLNHIKIL
jgi:hypothetical protein